MLLGPLATLATPAEARIPLLYPTPKVGFQSSFNTNLEIHAVGRVLLLRRGKV